MGCSTGIDPVPSGSQPEMQATTLRTPLNLEHHKTKNTKPGFLAEIRAGRLLLPWEGGLRHALLQPESPCARIP